MRILLTGITGGIGARLAPRLLHDGHAVRGMTRRAPASARRADISADVELVQGDAVSASGLERALDGIEVAYYLIHSMEPSGDGPFEARERTAAENFARAARRAGVRRIVYLGGLYPASGPASRHLASRLAVERVLLESTPDSVAFRASIVIGAHSRSFRFLVRLVERLPVLVVPAWREHRTAPIDERDVIEYLARAAGGTGTAAGGTGTAAGGTGTGPGGVATGAGGVATGAGGAPTGAGGAAPADGLSGASLDIAGPDTISYRELIECIRDELLVSRPVLGLPHLTLTPIASRISALLAGEQPELIEPLMEGLGSDLLPRDARAVELVPFRRHRLRAAIERALREWEAVEPLRAR